MYVLVSMYYNLHASIYLLPNAIGSCSKKIDIPNKLFVQHYVYNVVF